jgi:DNA-binding IclR family transcriptional regulator
MMQRQRELLRAIDTWFVAQGVAHTVINAGVLQTLAGQVGIASDTVGDLFVGLVDKGLVGVMPQRFGPYQIGPDGFELAVTTGLTTAGQRFSS